MTQFRLVYTDPSGTLDDVNFKWHGLADSESYVCGQADIEGGVSEMTIWYNTESVYALDLVDGAGNSILMGSSESKSDILSFYLDFSWLDGLELFGFRTETTTETGTY